MILSQFSMSQAVILGGLTGTIPGLVLAAAVPGDGAVQQVGTITFSSPSNSSPYSVSFTDPSTGQTTTVAITTDGSATAAEASAAFLAAAEADPIANGFASFVDDLAGVVTYTVRQPNRTITVAEVVDTGAHMAVAVTTAAAAASTYPLGRVVQLSATTATNQYIASLPDTPTQGTAVVTITHAASSTYRIALGVRDANGTFTSIPIAFSAGANVTATGAAAVAAVAASTAAYGVAGLIAAAAASPSGSDVAVTITLPAGWAYVNSATTGDVTSAGAAALAFAAGTTAGSVPPIALVYHPGNLSSATIAGAQPTAIDAGTTVPIALSKARVNVPNLSSGSLGTPLFYETAAGASRGLLVVTPTATCLPAPGYTLLARNLTSVGADTLSQVEIA